MLDTWDYYGGVKIEQWALPWCDGSVYSVRLVYVNGAIVERSESRLIYPPHRAKPYQPATLAA